MAATTLPRAASRMLQCMSSIGKACPPGEVTLACNGHVLAKYLVLYTVRGVGCLRAQEHTLVVNASSMAPRRQVLHSEHPCGDQSMHLMHALGKRL